MRNAIQTQLARFKGNGFRLRAVDPALLRTAVPALLAAAAITALVLMFLWREQSNYKPLFGAKENIAPADVIAVLDAEHVAYRLHPESGQILVAESGLGRARMLLAAKGVVAKLPDGLELMDRNDPLGVSQFVQDVRFRRGLEGELVKSITTLDAVQGARVHLSIARSSSFVVNTGDKSSASVVLKLKQGRQLSREQIAAVVNLVATSVAGLEPSRVTLADQGGNFLSSRVDLSEGFDSASGGEAEQRYAEEARRNVQELLAPTVGAGNFRVSVTAEVNHDRVEETREQFGGDPRVLTEATREEADRNALAVGVPGSLSNRPIPQTTTSASGPMGENNFRSAVSRNYTYDRSTTQIKRSKVRLSRLSVAVVLNDAAAPAGAAHWADGDVARIEKLLKTGLGVDLQRGDQLAVSSMAFPTAVVAPVWWTEPENIFDMVVVGLWALGGLIGLLVLRSIVRTLMRRPLGSTPLEPLAHGAGPLDKPALGRPEGEAEPALAALPLGSSNATHAIAMVPLLEDVDLPPLGSPVDVMVDHLRSLADKEPARVAEVVKQWVQKHGQPQPSGR
ncbi:MAG TPA: flagellar basal-body MS-ring/collar protein FliF [Rhizobacter sp.]|nr:flagellar basal-body MS-ring/collar protein FliF [Rhizobacter sp.]